MLYVNKEMKVVEKEMHFGRLRGISVGEYDRGRREIFLPTPAEVTKIENLEEELTIGLSKTGRPRINRTKDNNLYLILSSERGYTRRGDGSIRALKNQEVEVIAKGNGADGDAGRIGSWDAVIVKAQNGDVFRVTWGGYGYGYDSTFYVVKDGQVLVADQPDIEYLYDTLNLEVPFSLEYNDGKTVIVSDEWRYL